MTDQLEFRTSMFFEYGVPAEMTPGVQRLVANNPSSFTFKGTNSYLVGSKSLAVIDPGPEDPTHMDAILKAAAGRPITHIFITHRHRDHVDGCPALVAATGAKTCAAKRQVSITEDDMTATPTGNEFIAHEFDPDIVLEHGDKVSGEDWALESIATPGHAPDHLCLALGGQDVLFCGDHIMAWNTTVIAPPEGNMADYFTSLERVFSRDENLYLPGHGGRIEAGRRTAKAYLLHRKWREQAILDVIRSEPTTIRKIVQRIYQDLDEKLHTAAALSVQAHVQHLMEKSQVHCTEAVSFDSVLSAGASASSE